MKLNDRELFALMLGVLTHPRFIMRLQDGTMGTVFARGDIDNLVALIGEELGIQVSEQPAGVAAGGGR